MKIEQLDLYALKYFFDTVEQNSVVRASEINFVTRSAVSQAINRLEAWAGSPLTTHTKRNFELTEQGLNFYRKMKVSFAAFKNAIENQLVEPDTLKIGCSTSVAESYLLPSLKNLSPMPELDLIVGTSSQLLAELKEEKIHLALFVGSQNPRMKSAKIVHQGRFSLVSKAGKISNLVITTEDRPEVLALKAHLLRTKKRNVKYLKVASWSVGLKLAEQLGCAALIPDFMKGNLIAIKMPEFNFKYQILCQHLGRHKLSLAELRLLDSIAK